MLKIPDKNRPEWKKMISGEIAHNYKNYVLQMQTTQMRRYIKNKKLTYDEAVNKLYILSYKYSRAVKSDLEQIFKIW
ncbi:MAG: hypothetical protein B6I24_05770 [Bacteroidetes bacterium 4572_128]|nr:MAG: hypothetical protein B6I24_05770 [Bacteroidetes bacterium 4572_128]